MLNEFGKGELPARTLIAGVLVGLSLGFATVSAEAQVGKSLDGCQKAVGKETDKYIRNLSDTIGRCLQSVSTNVLAKNRTVADAARSCVSQLARIEVGSDPTQELGGKFEDKLARSCDSSSNPSLAHNDTDIISIGAAAISAGNLNDFCVGFGGDGSIDSYAEWRTCLRKSAECQAHQSIATQYPRALEYFQDLASAIALLPATSDTTDALAALAVIDAAIEGNNNDNIPEIRCESPVCGNDVAETGEACDTGDFSGTTCASLGFVTGNLACNFCMLDASGCTGVGLPATGEQQGYGPYSDGWNQYGATLSYNDNGDGTITDNNTGLMWEKKDDSGGLHDYDNLYTWCSDLSPVDGACDSPTLPQLAGTLADFIDALNDVAGGGTNCFAGYCDWRVPNYRELQSLADLGRVNPAIDPAFHQTATCTGCTNITSPTCSCTESATDQYWSSTTWSFDDGSAWAFSFFDGSPTTFGKGSTHLARAVRTGP